MAEKLTYTALLRSRAQLQAEALQLRSLSVTCPLLSERLRAESSLAFLHAMEGDCSSVASSVADVPTCQEVRDSLAEQGGSLGLRIDVRFFEGGYSYHVVPEPGRHSDGVAGIDVVGSPAHATASHQQPNHAGLLGLDEIECGIVLYGKGRKGSYRRERRAHWDGGFHG